MASASSSLAVLGASQIPDRSSEHRDEGLRRGLIRQGLTQLHRAEIRPAKGASGCGGDPGGDVWTGQVQLIPPLTEASSNQRRIDLGFHMVPRCRSPIDQWESARSGRRTVHAA